MGYLLKIVEVKLNLKVPICQVNSNGIFECQSSNMGYWLKLPKSSKFEDHNCQASRFRHSNQLFKRFKINTPIGSFILRESIKTYKTMRQSKTRKQRIKRKVNETKQQKEIRATKENKCNGYIIMTNKSIV
jgi:hypothetical protein